MKEHLFPARTRTKEHPRTRNEQNGDSIFRVTADSAKTANGTVRHRGTSYTSFRAMAAFRAFQRCLNITSVKGFTISLNNFVMRRVTAEQRSKASRRWQNTWFDRNLQRANGRRVTSAIS